MTLERKMSVGMVLAVIVQLAAVFMWAGASTARIAAVEAEMEARRPTAERLARIEARLELMALQLGRIEEQLDAR